MAAGGGEVTGPEFNAWIWDHGYSTLQMAAVLGVNFRTVESWRMRQRRALPRYVDLALEALDARVEVSA